MVITLIFKNGKGQIKLKAYWRAVDSPKKQTNEFVLFAFLLFTANKTNSFFRFLGRIYGTPKLLSVLSDLYEESLVSSNLNSKLHWFHSVIPNVSGFLQLN